MLDEAGDCRVVGWESVASSYLPVGSELSCWMLPTLVPAEHLLVRWMGPRPTGHGDVRQLAGDSMPAGGSAASSPSRRR